MLTLAEYERLAERMRDYESGSEAQIEAESLFYAAISRDDDGEGSMLGDDFDRWCEHVSVDEMLDEALRLLLMVKGFADRNPPTGPLLRDGIGTLTPIPTLHEQCLLSVGGAEPLAEAAARHMFLLCSHIGITLPVMENAHPPDPDELRLSAKSVREGVGSGSSPGTRWESLRWPLHVGRNDTTYGPGVIDDLQTYLFQG